MRSSLRNTLLAVLALLALSACATQANYERRLQTYVGQNISTVMAGWGYPSGSFEAPDGNMVYVWDHQSVFISSPSYFGGYYRRGYYGPAVDFPGQAYTYRCQTYFEVDKKKTILSWKVQGNDCRE